MMRDRVVLLAVELLQTMKSVRSMYAKGELMKLKWIESKAASTLFLCSAVLFLGLCVSTCLLVIPGVSEFLNASSAKNLLVIIFGILAVMGILSMFIVFGGMAIFCVCIDHSSLLRKLLWFVLFFGTGPIGSTVYYFAVYRTYIWGKKAGGAGSESLSPSNY